MGTGEPRPADQAMDAALRRALRPAHRAAARGCDAELAVAYVEGRLNRREREGFETHMAECAGCRALCAALVEELVPAAPEAEAPAPLPRPWWTLSWRWAVPALAGVAIVGSVVYYQRDRVLERRAETLPVAESAATPAPAMTPPAPAAAREEAPSIKPERPAAARERNVAAPPQAAKQVPAPVMASSDTEAELRKKKNARNFVAGAPAAPPPANAPAVAQGTIGGVAPINERSELKAITGQPAAPPPANAPAADPVPTKGAISAASPAQEQDGLKVIAGQPGARQSAAAPAAALKATGGGAPIAQKTAARDDTADASAAKVTAGVAGGRAQSAALVNRFDSLVLPGGARPRSVLRHEGRLWAVCDGGRIFRSTDEGRTWASIESPTAADLVSVKWDAERNLLLVTDRQGNEYRVKP